MLELFAFAFGQYADSFPVTLFTGKRAASNMQVDETEEGANINVGLMKQYTGGDIIKTRALYKDPIAFKPQFKIVLVCNELPKVPPYDGGVWRRLEVVEFISKFVEDPQNENEYPRDEQLSEKLKEWKEVFMGILLEYYKLYKKEGLRPPEEVTKYTKEYQRNCDAYADFVAVYMKYTGSEKNVVTLPDTYREFKMWHTQTNSSARLLGKSELGKYLERKLGKSCITNEFIKGYILLNHDKMISDLQKQIDEARNIDEEQEQEQEESQEIPEIEIHTEDGNYNNF